MKTDFPNIKTYEQDFILKSKKTKHLFTLRYKQATLWEYFEFYSKTPQEQFLELYEIIRWQIPYTLKEKILKKLFRWYKTKLEKLIDYDKIVINIMNNRFRIYESIFSKVKAKGKKWDKWLLSVSLLKVCKHYSTSLSDLLNNFTLEQFFWLLDWVVYNTNSQYKEGQKMNKEALQDKEEIKKRAEQTKKAFENIKI